MYQTNTGSYPSATEGLEALINRPASLDEDSTWIRLMNEIPVDPWQQPYHYIRSKSLPDSFGLYSTGPNMISDLGRPDSDDFYSWTSNRNNDSPDKKPIWFSLGMMLGACGGLALGIVRWKPSRSDRGLQSASSKHPCA